MTVQHSNEERQTVVALDHIARMIVAQCGHMAEWGGQGPYDTVMKALHRRILHLTQVDPLTPAARTEGTS